MRRKTLDGEPQLITLDAAIGTTLEERGIALTPPLWSADALLNHPQIVEQIHAEHAAAGARILIANTFRTNVRTLERAGLLPRGSELTQLAVALARRAAERVRPAALVAGSIAPAEDCYRPELVPDEQMLDFEHGAMMEWLAAAKVDLIWLETIGTVREIRAASRAAGHCGIDFAVCLLTREDGRLLSGEPLEEAVEEALAFDPQVVGLNCIPPSGMTANLPRLVRGVERCCGSGCGATAKSTPLQSDVRLPRIAAYAHIGNRRPTPGWSFAENATPLEYAEHAKRWLEAGATLIGGCCGTHAGHIRSLAALLKPPEASINSPS